MSLVCVQPYLCIVSVVIGWYELDLAGSVLAWPSNDKAKPTSTSAFQKDVDTREKSSCSPTTVKEQVKRLDERSTQKCDVCPFPAKSNSCLNIPGNLRNDHSDWLKEITAGINLC